MADLGNTGEARIGMDFLPADMDSCSDKEYEPIIEEDYNEFQMEEMMERSEPWCDKENLPEQTIKLVNVPKLKHINDLKKIASEERPL